MGLRCSLLGHDFGDTEVEREREERGSEVVVTVREYEECIRCGEKHVVSESTEVTSLSTANEGGRDPIPDEPVEPDSEPIEPEPEPEPEPAGTAAEVDDAIDGVATTDDAEILEDTPEVETGTEPAEAPDDPSATDAEVLENDAEVLEYDADAEGEPLEASTAEASTDDDPEIPVDETGEPITDDAEILEETEPREGDREHGEWPDASDVGPPVGAEAEPTAWPEMDDADAPADSDADTGDSSGLFADFEAEEQEAAESEEDELESGTGIASAQSAPAPGTVDRREDVATEFFCPRCEFVVPGDRGSLRAGDICPECRKGYLGEREL